VLREENRRQARLIRLPRDIYRRGERVSVELVLELAANLKGLDTLEQLCRRFSRFDPSFLRDRIGHEFPPGPIRSVDR
jgi:hypothetical protein